MKSTRAKIVDRLQFALLAAGLMSLCGAGSAQAHAFGPRYDLPLPLELYLTGAGAAVALSFVVMALFFRDPALSVDKAGIDLLRFRPLCVLLNPMALRGLQAVSLALFILVLAAGFFGNQDTIRNLAPTFVWIIWWVGLAYVAALAGNPWPFINPWSIAFAGCERLVRRLGARRGLSLDLPYPAWLGVWPAALLFGAFAWFELIAETGTLPRVLATAILIYSGLTWIAMAIFGREVWLNRGEAFSLAFGVFGRFAPLGGEVATRPNRRPHHWRLRPYASGLVVERPCSLSMTFFVLVMLSTVTFDGFKETPAWGTLLQSVAVAPSLHPAIRMLHDFGFDFQVVLETVVLALFPLLFLTVYLGFSWLATKAAGSRRPVTEIAGLFVFSLVPIAIAYHLAHYLSYLLVAGQFIIPLASDPFGIGWDLFGTAGYEVDFGVIGARTVWYTAVIAIVVGHVIAVGVAHFAALRVFETTRSALRSQYPFLVLMVAYTILSLWILSQPIVGGPDLGRLPSPSGRLSLAPFEFREQCFEMTASQELSYSFEADRPLEFNIHYHDGLTTRYAVSSPGVRSQSGRFVPERDHRYCVMWLNRSLLRASMSYRVAGP